QPEKFKSWAISIVNRRAIDWIRASNRERHKLHLLYEEAPKVSSILEENTDQQEKKIRLKAAIEKLTVQQKTIIDLFYTQEYSLNEISELLHISVGTAKSRLFHAREKLKSILKK
ncbi:MAG: sigma-70 family RNA polymerase sigma factor, partial [Flavobacteriaceae bacterium]|nr:sigma-70 family RNA polymerase sigma factor [Flavobacteriaceae bacterium]